MRDLFEFIAEGDLGMAAGGNVSGVGNMSPAGDHSLASMSMLAANVPSLAHEMVRAAYAQSGRNAAREARLEMGLSARQHLTQLSLRLDYNGFFTGTFAFDQDKPIAAAVTGSQQNV